MEILHIEQSKYHADSFLVYLDTGEKFRVFRSMLREFDLYEGRRLSPGEYEGIRAACECSEVEDLARSILRERPMNKQELTLRLREHGVGRELAEATAIYMEQTKALDESKFAAMLVQHYASRCYGPEKIKEEFFLRNVDFSLWDEALKAMPSVAETIDRKLPTLLEGKAVTEKLLARARAHLLKRGFPYADIEAGIARYLLAHGQSS